MATQFIKLSDVSSFIAALGPPLGIPKPNDSAITVMDFAIMREPGTDEEVVHCIDVLMGLVRKALGSLDETDEFRQVKTHLEALFKTSFPGRGRHCGLPLRVAA